MGDLDTREWLLTNGLGSFASGTVSDARTRTYHGWLVAALNPPRSRTMLFSHLEACLEVSGEMQNLGTNFWGSGIVEPLGYKLLRSFSIDPIPTWVWGESDWQLTRQIVMPHEGEKAEKFSHCVLIQYRYEGKEAAILRLRLMIGDRNFHHQQRAEPNLQFSQSVKQNQLYLQAIRPGQIGTLWQLQWTRGEYQANPLWYWDYQLIEETRRGLGDREDLHSPGYLTVKLLPGESLTIEASLGSGDTPILKEQDFTSAVESQQSRFKQLFSATSVLPQLLQVGDSFIVYRQSIKGLSAIAGYHWFNDWGRDTLIALPGLALTTKRFDLAKGLLQTFGRYCRDGLIPNAFPDTNSEPFYNSLDATLWWIEALGLYLEATKDWDFLIEQYPTVRQIYKAFSAGTKYNIQVDAADGLLGWDAPHVALTWMDAVIGTQPVTARCGKPVEINALWYSALCWSSSWAERLFAITGSDRYLKQSQYYTAQSQQVKDSLQKFWNPLTGYLYDLIEPDDLLNAQIRPNAVLALSLHYCAFSAAQGQRIVEVAKNRLLTPYGLRSLDPTDPEYIGNYAGNSYHRDLSYHQGTVWMWLMGAFIRAWQRFYPDETLPISKQPLLEHLYNSGCIGSISEIFDGDPPHAPQGAVSQAWSVAELIRHWHDIKS
ncbi:amylo-alpha-1,6-glucosidase [Synechocystis sp. PCC 7509]|uniref:amylo-alpha-1,6-glucosidase n=1 Tax=Synechocystis sp. PCC 7509 TaxID=927677 RepID=UPI0002AD0E92|nr:amylo-alpha-1,6-glucosidase [Synechocystis sp. PCC 7509]